MGTKGQISRTNQHNMTESLTPTHSWIITLYNLALFSLLPFDPLRICSLSPIFINFKPGCNLRAQDPT
jgi:hypothetical protein